MLFPIENVEDLQKLNKSISIESQVKAVRLEDRLGEQNYHHKTEKLFEPVVDITRKNFKRSDKNFVTEISNNNNKAIEKINEKF